MSHKHRAFLLSTAFVVGCSFLALAVSAGVHVAAETEKGTVPAVTCEASLSPSPSGGADAIACAAETATSSALAFSFRADEESLDGSANRLPQCSCTYCEANLYDDCAARGLGFGPCGLYLYLFCDPPLAAS